MTTGAWVVERLMAKPLAPPPAQPGTGPPAFLERLPLRLRSAELYAIESEDHYLRVHTSAGQELILLRLADAVRELAGVEGLQTHRSWWVAKQGLADVMKGDGRLVLKLKSGAEAPVSRTYAKAVRDAGWN
jgi:DNA-binding LytR/AlgR family response regulator